MAEQRRSHRPGRLGVSPAHSELRHPQKRQSRLQRRAQHFVSSNVEPSRFVRLPVPAVLSETGQLPLLSF